MDRLKLALVFAFLSISPAVGQTSCGVLTSCPNASLPLSGTESLYIVQQGISKQITEQYLADDVSSKIGLNPGTLGQIPYYSAPDILSPLGPFTAGLPIIGAGTGGIAAGTRTGTTTEYASVTGTLTSGHCAAWASGNLTDAGQGCISVATCIASPTVCIDLFGYVNPLWYGAACNGVTDDTSAVAAAVAAANGLELYFPAGATCVIQYMDICKLNPCQNTDTGGSVPVVVEGNGATLLAPAAAAGRSSFVYIEAPTTTDGSQTGNTFVFRDFTINGGGYVDTGLYVYGCVYCYFSNIGEWNAQTVGCRFDSAAGVVGPPAVPAFINADSVYERIQCSTNNENSGSTGTGILETTSAGFNLGVSCPSKVAQNAGNAFVGVHALWNGLVGWNVDCANNSHYDADMEENLSYGLSITNSVASQWIGTQFAANKNAHGTPGSGGDASVINNDNSPGLQFFGGASTGTFTNVSGAHNDTLAMYGETGFGYTANCNSTTYYCMTLP